MWLDIGYPYCSLYVSSAIQCFEMQIKYDILVLFVSVTIAC